MVARSLFSRYFLARLVTQSEALKHLGAAPLRFSRVRVLTILPDRLQILFPIRLLTNAVDSHEPFFTFLFECLIFSEENAQSAQSLKRC